MLWLFLRVVLVGYPFVMWPLKWRLSCRGLSYPPYELLARVEISFSFSLGEPLRLP